MKKKIISLLVSAIMLSSCSIGVFAEEVSDAEVVTETITETVEETTKAAPITSDTFTVHIDVLEPEGFLEYSTLRFNLFSSDGEWLGNRYAYIENSNDLTLEFNVPTYEIGESFQLVPTTGVDYIQYYDEKFSLEQPITVETYSYRNENGNLIICDEVHVSANPLFVSWGEMAENHVNEKKIWSDTPYLIWVSKANFTVSVFLRENGRWNFIKSFACSIGAPGTPTVTGQFKYYQYQKKWDYGSYYVGPIMRFYGGYAIHSTLVNNDGTDRDGRVGKMISHGCVRVRPENIRWLVDYIPLNTKIYITNQ